MLAFLQIGRCDSLCLLARLMAEDQEQIYTVFIKAYHKALYDFLKEFVASAPGAGALLRLAQFCKEYTNSMTKELEIPIELLEPKLLDGKQQDLIEDYLGLIVGKMTEWTENIMRVEIAEFTTRDKPPEVDADNLYGMEGVISLFNSRSRMVVCTIVY